MRLIFRVCAVAAVALSVEAHVTDYIKVPGLNLPNLNELNTRVLIIETFADFLWANFYVGYEDVLMKYRIFYYMLYLGVGTALESTNPAPKTEYRKRMTKKEITLGLSALFWVILTTTFWFW